MSALKKNKIEKFLQDEVKDQYQILTDKIVAKMEDSVKYEKPWLENMGGRPYNPVTKVEYSGINWLSLIFANYEDPRFLTYKHIEVLASETKTDIHLKKGSKGVPIFKAMQKTYTSKDKETGEETSFGVWRQVYLATVFNASQIENMPALEKKEVPDFKINEELKKIAEAMVASTGLKISHHKQSRAYYTPKEDKICIPNITDFKSESLYQRTLAHELGHATGHEKRLNRNLANQFGSEEYAKEELIAELSSYFLGDVLGFSYDAKTHENHAAYLKSWIGALKSDKGFIFKAASAAKKVVEFQIDTKKTYFNEFTQEELAKRKELAEFKSGEITIPTGSPKKLKIV